MWKGRTYLLRLDNNSDEDTPIKQPHETNIPEPKLSLNTFGLPKTTSVPVPKVVKTEITSKKKSKKKEIIKMVKGNKEKKKENATRPPLFRKKDFDIMEQLQNQPVGLSWADALEIPSIRKGFFEVLRKSKEKEIKLADQEYSLKTTALKYNVAIEVYTVPIIVDSDAAISIITRDTMKQLGYEIEEASKNEESADESDTETEESKEDDKEIIFKNIAIEDDDDKNDEDTVPVFLSEKLNKNELDIGQLNNN
ncbi:hypothetical protein Glove_444g36 [Diversispora epigaea]|uniref:Uncharacterized protein n=1 Tax=Diversispora epigaea TaxID=1348612 RepID=A0A397GUH5_9GLOM|nr:hypothetical protein Glove_444g36 [Diversispora epigaea]